jgi:hypothetical protein
MGDNPVTTRDNKINGFDKWEIREAADALVRAESIKNDKRKKFYKTVMAEVDKKARDADQAAANAHQAAKKGKAKVSVGGLFKEGNK